MILVDHAVGELTVEGLHAVENVERDVHFGTVPDVVHARTQRQPGDRIVHRCDVRTELVAHLGKRSSRKSERIAVERETLLTSHLDDCRSSGIVSSSSNERTIQRKRACAGRQGDVCGDGVRNTCDGQARTLLDRA